MTISTCQRCTCGGVLSEDDWRCRARDWADCRQICERCPGSDPESSQGVQDDQPRPSQKAVAGLRSATAGH